MEGLKIEVVGCTVYYMLLNYLCFMYQIQIFFIATEWEKISAYGVRLDRVPGLNPEIEQSIKAHIRRNKLGTNSIPRRFVGRVNLL